MIEANYSTVPNRSTTLNKLFSALSKAQAEMEAAGLDSNNPYFKSRYSNLATIVKASRPYLTKYGLCISQPIMSFEDTHLLVTIIGHESGEFLAGNMRITPAKNDIQSMGSYITYLRRYNYAAAVGVICDDDSDDDGEIVMATTRNPLPQDTPAAVLITNDQVDILREALDGHPNLLRQILEGSKISSLNQLEKSKFASVFKWIQKVKNIQSEGKP